MKSIQLRPFQLECINRAVDLIQSGKKRVTILTPAGTGKTAMAVHILNRINISNAYILVDNKVLVEQWKAHILEIDISNITCITVNDFIEKNLVADCIILFDVRPASRDRLSKCLNNKELTIISFGIPCLQSINNRNESNEALLNVEISEIIDGTWIKSKAAYFRQLNDIQPIVYATNSIIDIRDIVSATSEEKTVLQRQINKEYEELSNELEILSSYSKQTNDNNLLKILELQNRKIKFMEQLLSSCGISSETLSEEFAKLEQLREELRSDLHSPDSSIREKAISIFESTIAESVNKTTMRVFTMEDKNRYTDILKDFLSTDIWCQKISDESKSYLISAKMNFDAMQQMQDRDQLDFSGVCLLVTKAFDTEISRRLYDAYRNYLMKRFPLPKGIDKWPNSMLNKARIKVLDSKDFTLGTVMYVTGISEDGEIKSRYTYNRFMEYAYDELYINDLSNKEISAEVKNLVRYVEKVRCDYRNPSAHRKSIDYITAEACIDYVLETYKILKEILINMQK